MSCSGVIGVLLRKLQVRAVRCAGRQVHARRVALPPSFSGVSICFDDFPSSAATVGRDLVEAVGGKATYFAAAGLLETEGMYGPMASMSQVVSLLAGGHEVGCHTFSHLDCTASSDRDLLCELERNLEALTSLGDAPLQSFAFPFGRMNMHLKRLLSRRFASLRSIDPGVERGTVDLLQLRGNKLYSSHNWVARAELLLRGVATGGGWLIVYTHDVSDTPTEFGVTLRDLAGFTVQCRRFGIPIRTVGDVVRELRVHSSAC